MVIIDIIWMKWYNSIVGICSSALRAGAHLSPIPLLGSLERRGGSMPLI